MSTGTLRAYTCMYTIDKSTKRWTLTSLKIDEPFGVRFHFERFFFLKPMSVNARVVLLVGDDKTTYMLVTCVSTKR